MAKIEILCKISLLYVHTQMRKRKGSSRNNFGGGGKEGVCEEKLDVVEPRGIAALENLWCGVLENLVTKYTNHGLLLKGFHVQIQMSFEDELLILISPLSSSTPVSLPSCCGMVRTKPIACA